LITFTFSYISFPLYNDDYNFTKEETPKQTIEKMIDRGLYIIINNCKCSCSNCQKKKKEEYES